MQNKKRIFIIHGWDSNPNEAWINWLVHELRHNNHDAIALDMPAASNPILTTWVAFLCQMILDPDKNTFLVGYDLGGTALLHFLSKMPQDMAVGGVVLIAPIIEPIGLEVIDNFLVEPINWSRIRSHTHRISAIYSSDDVLVPIHQAQVLEKKLKANIIIEENLKHFTSAEKVTKVPAALNSLLEMIR